MGGRLPFMIPLVGHGSWSARRGVGIRIVVMTADSTSGTRIDNMYGKGVEGYGPKRRR